MKLISLSQFSVLIPPVNMSHCAICPRSAILFGVQTLTLLTIITIAVVKITTQSEYNDVWVSLMSGAVGCLFPAPKLRRLKCACSTAV